MKPGDIVGVRPSAVTIADVRIYRDILTDTYDTYFLPSEVGIIIEAVGDRVIPYEFMVRVLTSAGNSGWVFGRYLDCICQ